MVSLTSCFSFGWLTRWPACLILSCSLQIKEVVIAEVKGAKVRHKDNIKLLLKSVAPKAVLTSLPLTHEKDRGR